MLRGSLYSLGLNCLNLAQRREGAFVKHFLGTVFRIPDCYTASAVDTLLFMGTLGLQLA